MRTNGFALFRGPGSSVSAEKAVIRVKRFSSEVVISSGSQLHAWVGGGDIGDACLVAYALEEGRDMPLVHGFVEGGAADGNEVIGEFAMLSSEGGTLVAERDGLGTRPLYVDAAGSCIASDHRFMTQSPRLLAAGSALEIDSMRLRASSLPTSNGCASLDDCAASLAVLLKEAVRRRVRGKKKVAVSFSGGLDSSLIAMLAAEEAETLLCCAYVSGSRDEEQARVAAGSLGLELVGVEVDRFSAEQELRSLDLPFAPTPMDKALWCIYSTTAREAAARGAELMMLGQLADELFGGYMKYARAAVDSEDAAAAMMHADVVASGQRAFIRDEEAVARFTEARFPFADGRLAAFALGIPVRYKIADGERKLVLRKAASILGLPEDLATAPKKAAQYSSGIAKLVP